MTIVKSEMMFGCSVQPLESEGSASWRRIHIISYCEARCLLGRENKGKLYVMNSEDDWLGLLGYFSRKVAEEKRSIVRFWMRPYGLTRMTVGRASRQVRRIDD